MCSSQTDIHNYIVVFRPAEAGVGACWSKNYMLLYIEIKNKCLNLIN